VTVGGRPVCGPDPPHVARLPQACPYTPHTHHHTFGFCLPTQLPSHTPHHTFHTCCHTPSFLFLLPTLPSHLTPSCLPHTPATCTPAHPTHCLPPCLPCPRLPFLTHATPHTEPGPGPDQAVIPHCGGDRCPRPSPHRSPPSVSLPTHYGMTNVLVLSQ